MDRSARDPSIIFRWYDPVLLRIIPPVLGGLVKLLLASCRPVAVAGAHREAETLAASGGKVIYVTWHQRMSYLFYVLGPRRPRVMISQSRDGEYAARVAHQFGFRDVRGSTTRRGFGALKELIGASKAGERMGMLADGPRGPARTAKIGTIILARDGESPILPILWGADRCWIFNSWDRFMIPKPFARIALYFAPPIQVERSARKQALEHYRQLLEQALDQGTRWCDDQFGRPRPWRKEPRPAGGAASTPPEPPRGS